MPTRGKFVWNPKTGKMKRVKEFKPKKQVHEVNQDTVERFQCPICHKKEFWESKSAYRRHLRAHGFRDTGGEHLQDRPHGKTEEEIDREYQEGLEEDYYNIKYDRVPFSEKEKELHKREERACPLNQKLKPR